MNQTCPSCHKEIKQEDTFCSHCGTQISTSKPISKAQKIKVYVLSFLLAPFGLYWFFKYRNEEDPEKKLVAKRVLWITIAAVIFVIATSITAANSYNKLINSYIYGYGL